MKNQSSKRGRKVLAFFSVLISIFVLTNMIYLPKWEEEEDLSRRQQEQFYDEPKNSIDVLLLGSCNMFSSFSPVLFWEEYGVTSYLLGCADQEMWTSYHYLVDALKTQDIKVVVVEALFLTCPPTASREHYNRLSLDHMPLSLNKMQLMDVTTKNQVEAMTKLTGDSPSRMFTYVSYLFPVLRYHARDDLSLNDITYYFDDRGRSLFKGGVPLYSYYRGANVEKDELWNGKEIRPEAAEYFDKIVELCEEKDIELILTKSPNHLRWNEYYTEMIGSFAEERNITYLDYHDMMDELNFDRIYFSNTTSRLNLYGMQKMTHELGTYIVENCNVQQHRVDEETAAHWDQCVEQLYEYSAEKKFPLDEFRIRKTNGDDGKVTLNWTPFAAADGFNIYRRKYNEEEYVFYDTTGEEISYTDEAVEMGEEYYYQVRGTAKFSDGTEEDFCSEEYRIEVGVKQPEISELKADRDRISLDWTPSEIAHAYEVYRRTGVDGELKLYDTVYTDSYEDLDVTEGESYDYQIRAVAEINGTVYYSKESNIMNALAYDTGERCAIHSITGQHEGISIKWDAMNGASEYILYRKEGEGGEFIHWDTVEDAYYTNIMVEAGEIYYYKVQPVYKDGENNKTGTMSNVVSAIATTNYE